MSFLDKFVNAMNMNDDDDYDYDDDEFEEEEAEAPRAKKFFQKKEEVREEARPARSSKIMPMRQARKKNNSDYSGREICMFKPSSTDESCDIMDALLSDRTVVLNLEGMNEDMAQKIIDTLSGACYALSGNMQKISNYIFIVAPRSVELSGDARGDIMQNVFEAHEQAVAGRF